MTDYHYFGNIPVREYAENDPVQLWRHENGRLCIRAFNEGGHNCVDLDVGDLIEWIDRFRETLSEME